MNILYIHGLNGSLSPEKRIILEQYGVVYAPSIDYENRPNVISGLSAAFNSHDINVVIGSSMGGFTGYYVSNRYQCPALLFNPALANRSVHQEIPELEHKKSILKHFVLGTADDVVNPVETLQFLANTIELSPEYNIHLRNDLAHRIPLDVFKEEVKHFFSKL
ncbi:YqiA/YcfP family alpha/beta fold hydrolase [Winogradskyella helgolandensis]|uniref:YqiA/YcfP family alpha/beta fold hydrolase n=1 Tax=Winogradskyella helgolandensis TaxID=2697010 RepID=UPI0015BC54EA|nr:YqiA/YcfP family alpha/beta fold hydrolase [Winogradskyella helgolandensis]